MCDKNNCCDDGKCGRIFNFSAGPSCLSMYALEKAHKDFFNYQGAGQNVMEMSHRSKDYDFIHNEAIRKLKELLKVPEGYEVLFIAGGATAQFSAIPMNLCGEKETADYIVTGTWSKKAAAEAKKYCNVNIAATGDNKSLPTDFKFSEDAAYIHFCSNETIGGVQFIDFPEFPKDKVVVCDMSSDILSRPLDMSKFDVIYGGAQKNIGPAGMAIVIIKKSLLERPVHKFCPVVMNYKTQADANSMYNTPSTWSIYMAGLAFDWLNSLGGLEAIQKINEEKAKIVYDAIEKSKMFKCPVAENARSLMNITFVIDMEKEKADKLTTQFIAEAKDAGMINLKGHRSVGGMRASTYNAFPIEGCKALAAFMEKFEEKNL